MSDKSRRKLLKSIALGSGAVVAGKSLPESWSRPVVDSVMLPAHAQTSGGPFAGGAVIMTPALESDSILEKAADILVPEAKADSPTNPYVCVEPNAAGDKATVKLYVDFPDTELYTFTEVPVNGSRCSYVQSSLCKIMPGKADDLLEELGLIKEAHAEPEPICCYLNSVNGTAVGYIDFYSDTFNFSVGPSSCNPTINCPVIEI